MTKRQSYKNDIKMKRLFLAALSAASILFAKAQTTPVYQDETKPLEERVQDALSRMTLEEKCRMTYAQSKFTSPGCPRLGIPELYMSDGPHGVRMEINWNDWGHSHWTNDYCTAFPALTCLAATWDPELATLYGKSVGEEARYRKKNILLGPGVNIYRTPLNGRNFEYMGEDPYLAGAMAVPYIQGLQSNGVACCLKHFVLNDQEEFRGHVDVKVSDRAFHEIYLAPFKAAIQQGGAWSIMGSYNCYRGVHVSHNPYLLNDILKDELGFKGAVITDWGAAHDTKQSVFYGLDIEMGSYTNGLTTEAAGFGYDDYYLGKRYLEMAKKGEVSMDIVNDKAARILRLIFLTSDRRSPYGSLNSPEHIAANRKIAQEGIVLLKNDKTKTGVKLLPIEASNYKTVLVVGDNATKSLCAGGGSSELKPKDEVSPLRAIKERYGSQWTILYSQGYESGASRYDGADVIPQTLQDSLRADALDKAKKADLIIYIGGLNKNHFEDCEGGDRRFYNMSYGQDALISDLLAIQPNMITVITSGNSVAMPWVSKTCALVQNWYGGSEAGHALVDVLSGDVNPSGKTVFSYAARLEDYPAHQYGLISYPGVEPKNVPDAFKSLVTGFDRVPSGLIDEASVSNSNPRSADIIAKSALLKKSVPAGFTTADINTDFNGRKHMGKGNEVQFYAEDIFVGYRYFDTKKQPVVFPFGYGLSYTTFAYSNPTISSKTIAEGETLTVTIDVKNTGDRDGKEVVQLYIGDDKASVARPAKELKSFKKVALKAGETKTVTFTISADDLKFYDENTHKWIAEPGTFKAYIGASVADIKASMAFKL